VASDEQITALSTIMVTGTALSQLVPRLLCVVRLRDVEGGRMLVSDYCAMISETRDSVTDETVALIRVVEHVIGPARS
jgi:hypothetical protein